MKNVPQTELLSAYLDGELAAEERADVERMLAASPAARQMLEEFRTLSSTLQSLPTHKLPDDMSQRVLRLAERRMLSETADESSGEESTKTASGAWWATARRMLSPRALAWSGVAVAVAVLLLIMDPARFEPDASREVAMSPQPAEEPPVASSIRAVPRPAERIEPGDRPPAAEPADEDRRLGEAESEVSAAAAKTTPAVPPAGAVAAKPNSASGLETSGPQRDAADKSKIPLAESAPSIPAPSVVAGKRPAVAGGLGGVPERAAGAGKPSATPLALPADAASPPSKAPVQYAPKPAEGVLRVFCDVSAEAARDDLLRQLLTQRKIVPISPAEADSDEVKEDAGGGRGGEGSKKVLAGPAPQLEERGPVPNPPSRIELRVTAVQLEAVLVELSRRPEEFLSVNVVPGAGSQGIESLTRYNRIHRKPTKSQEGSWQMNVRRSNADGSFAGKGQASSKAGLVKAGGQPSMGAGASSNVAAGGRAFRGVTAPSRLGQRGLRMRTELFDEPARPGAAAKMRAAKRKRAKQGSAEQDRAKQDRAEQDRAKPKDAKSRPAMEAKRRLNARPPAAAPKGKPATYRVLLVLRVVSPSGPAEAVSVEEKPKAEKAPPPAAGPPKPAAAKAHAPQKAPAAAKQATKP